MIRHFISARRFFLCGLLSLSVSFCGVQFSIAQTAIKDWHADAYQIPFQIRQPNQADSWRVMQLNQSGMDAYRRGDEAAVIEAASEVLKLYETTWGARHAATAIERSKLAALYIELGKWSEAKTSSESAWTDLKDSLGQDHPYSLNVGGQYAQVLVMFGESSRSNDLFSDLIQTAQRAHEEDPEIAGGLQVFFGQSLNVQGRFADALEQFVEVQELVELNGSNGSPAIVEGLIASHQGLQNFDELVPLMEQAIDMSSAQTGSNSLLTLQAKGRLAGHLANQGDVERATALIDVVVRGIERFPDLDQMRLSSYHISAGQVYQALGNHDRAIEYLETALQLQSSVLGEDAAELNLIKNTLANLYTASGRTAKSETLALEVLAAAEQNMEGDHPDLAIPLKSLANVYINSGDFNKAETYIDRAIKVLDFPNNQTIHKAILVDVLGLKADLELERAAFSQAEKTLDRATTITSTLPVDARAPKLIEISMSRASMAFQRGDYQQVDDRMDAILESLSADGFGDNLLKSRALNLLLISKRAQNDISAVEEIESDMVFLGRQAASNSEYDIRTRLQKANLLITRAYNSGQFITALYLGEDAVDLAVDSGPEFKDQELLLRSATLGSLIAIGANDEAYHETRYIIQELESNEINRSEYVAIVAAFSAISLGDRELSARFIDFLESIADVRELTPDIVGSLQVLKILDTFARADFERSVQLTDVQLPTSGVSGAFNPLVERIRALALSETNEHAGAYQTAISALEKEAAYEATVPDAYRMVDSLIGKVVVGSGYELAQKSPNPIIKRQLHHRAFLGAQRGEMHAAVDALLGGLLKNKVGESEQSDYLTRLNAAQAAMANLDAKIFAESGGASSQSVRVNLQQAQSEARAELRAAEAAIETAFPFMLDFARNEPVTIDQLQNVLRDDEALIILTSYLNFDPSLDGDVDLSPHLSKGYVFAVSKHDASWLRIDVDPSDLDQQIKALHSGFATSGDISRSGGPVESHANVQGFPAALAMNLHTSLFGGPDIQRVIGDKDVWTVIPQGAFASIPFPALITSGQYADNSEIQSPEDFRNIAWLGIDKTLVIAPSVSSVRWARQSIETPNTATRTPFFGIGAPNFRGASYALPSNASAQSVRSGNHVEALRRLDPLPRTAVEIREMASALDARPGAYLLGDEATEKELRRFDQTGELGRAKVVAFATHGLVTGDLGGALYQPALALTPPEADGLTMENDGLLTASEAAQLSLSAEWLILSACNTASGGRPGDEYLAGLATSFLAAGAKSLLVSHYPVYDSAAEQLTTAAVKHAEEDGMTRAKSLQLSMMDLMNDTSRDSSPVSNAHPAVWAPFILIDPQ